MHMKLDLIRKILVTTKHREDLAELLKFSYGEINQSNTYSSRLYSFLSTFEIYSPLEYHSKLVDLSDIDKKILLDAILIAIPPKDHEVEIYNVEFFLDDSINIDTIDETFEITEVTKRNIIDEFKLGKFNIYGTLTELEFLKRIYDLKSLPSNDSRFSNAESDISKHTIMNDDWSEDWVFYDDRFKIINGSDQDFIKFICEVLHPAVQQDENVVNMLVDKINTYLEKDKWELFIDRYVSDKPVYSARKITIDTYDNESKKLEFRVVNALNEVSENIKNQFILKRDSWDDFCYRTTFVLYYFQNKQTCHQIGNLKIIKKDMQGGNVDIPNMFNELSDDYCSLGWDQNYYEEIMGIFKSNSTNIFKSLRDCAYNQNIYESFKDEYAMKKSLLRKITSQNVKETFKNIINKDASQTQYKFEFAFKNSDVKLGVSVIPNSNPPTNIQVLIGRNGVGKTRLLAGIAESIIEEKNDKYPGIEGQILFLDKDDESAKFSSLITMGFSPFDAFLPLTKYKINKKNIEYIYVGLKNVKSNKNKSDFKNLDDLIKDFKASIINILNSVKRERWINAIKILNSDPRFNELDLLNLALSNNISTIIDRYKTLSSGHRIVLLSITKLVDIVNDRTLLLLDEPENHLHPPLLSSYIRALSNLLKSRNAVAIIATHSPVVLQEVPKSCVSILNRYGNEYTISRPILETFGENVGILTREVFKLEVENSGFHNILEMFANDGLTYKEIMNKFENQIGIEGQAILRAILLNNKDVK